MLSRRFLKLSLDCLERQGLIRLDAFLQAFSSFSSLSSLFNPFQALQTPSLIPTGKKHFTQNAAKEKRTQTRAPHPYHRATFPRLAKKAKQGLMSDVSILPDEKSQACSLCAVYCALCTVRCVLSQTPQKKRRAQSRAPLPYHRKIFISNATKEKQANAMLNC